MLVRREPPFIRILFNHYLITTFDGFELFNTEGKLIHIIIYFLRQNNFDFDKLDQMETLIKDAQETNTILNLKEIICEMEK